MVDWQVMEGIGGIATAVAVLVAVAFGIAQVRQMRDQRAHTATSDAISKFLSPEFIRALDVVLDLPDDAPAATIRDSHELRRAVLMLDFTYEGIGILVHSGHLDLHAVDRHLGGVVRMPWPKVRRHVEEERARLASPSLGEWWQWLYERMEEDPAPGKREGAHVAFRDWRR